MSEDNDDLYGRQLVLLLVFFTVVGGGLYLVGWWAEVGLLRNPVACAAIAGGACYPARFLVERFAWWKRLEEPVKWKRSRRGNPQTTTVDGSASGHRRAGVGRPRWVRRLVKRLGR